MVDVAVPGIGTDHQSRDTQAVAVFVNMWWHDVVIEATPVIPGEEDRCTVPIWSLHDGVDEAGHIRLASADERRRMFAVLAVGDNPGNGWESSVLRGSIELRELLNVAKLAVLLDRVKIGQRVPDIGRACMLRLGGAGHSVILTVRLCSV